MNCWNSSGISEEFQRFHLFQSFSSNFPWLQWNSTKMVERFFSGNTLKYISWWVYFQGFTVYQKKNLCWVNTVNVLILAIKQHNIKLSCVSSIFLISLIKRSWCLDCIYGMVVMNNLGFPTGKNTGIPILNTV